MSDFRDRFRSPPEVESNTGWYRIVDGQIILTRGRYKGSMLVGIEEEYLLWLIGQPAVDETLKNAILDLT